MSLEITCKKCLTKSMDHRIKYAKSLTTREDWLAVTCFRCGAEFTTPCADAPKDKVIGAAPGHIFDTMIEDVLSRAGVAPNTIKIPPLEPKQNAPAPPFKDPFKMFNDEINNQLEWAIKNGPPYTPPTVPKPKTKHVWPNCVGCKDESDCGIKRNKDKGVQVGTASTSITWGQTFRPGGIYG
jgi:hypothetical protein